MLIKLKWGSLCMHKLSDKKVGLPPGSLVYTGRKKKGPIKIRVMDYNAERVRDVYISDVSELKKFVNSKSVSWINVIGVHHPQVIAKVGKLFNLHPLMLEDIVNVHGRTKLEVRDDKLFTQLKMIYFNPHKKLMFEQLSIILGNHFVITFQEDDYDVFDPVRERIRSTNWRIRQLDNDYLSYALIDAIVDNYFSIMEETGNQLDRIDDQVVKKPQENSLQNIHSLKKNLVLLRKNIWPVREIISKMKQTALIKKSTKPFIDDLYDHAVQIIDSIEMYREMSSSILETYLSNVSNKMNEIMKVLTVISTVFIPLTFITGVYGMNFTHMPEIPGKFSYYVVWAVMLTIGIWLFVYFKRKKWV